MTRTQRERYWPSSCFFLPVPGVNTDTGELPHIDPDLTEDEFEEAMT